MFMFYSAINKNASVAFVKLDKVASGGTTHLQVREKQMKLQYSNFS